MIKDDPLCYFILSNVSNSHLLLEMFIIVYVVSLSVTKLSGTPLHIL